VRSSAGLLIVQEADAFIFFGERLSNLIRSALASARTDA
jgi:hypothetical protein